MTTPEKAVARAFWMVNGPVLLVMLCPPLMLIAIGNVVGITSKLGAAFALASVPTFPISWVFAWLTWSVLTPRWRLRAYQNVDDIDELIRLAVAGRIIWPDGHVLGRTEIMSAEQKTKLGEIEAAKRRAMRSRTETSES